MSRSSPLAAMQPPQALPFSHGHWNFGMERPRSDPISKPLGYNGFDFGNMSMERRPLDYFSMQPSRGASPTACLAVDLSQNFHIDRSPLPATPRRSLFTTTMFGNIGGRELLITPPPPTSSPSPTDPMEISPLPHKMPFTTHIQVHSPTPEPTPPYEPTDSMLSSPCVIPESPLVTMKPSQPVDRQRKGMLRPPLCRTKGYTTTAISTKSALSFHSPSQPFMFGSGVGSMTTTMTLDECFSESPRQTLMPNPLVSAMGPPRPKSASQKSTAFAHPTGSPIAGHTRNPSAPFQKRRKAIRRSLSMVDKPADIFCQQPQAESADRGLNSIMDVDESPRPNLPHFMHENDPIPRISKETMVDVLDGRYSQHYDDSMIVDCRFEYEYKGGHIDGAVNFNDKEELAQNLFQQSRSPRTLLILHCEYSEFRAPMAASYIRCQDRNANTHQYPKLTYPEVYILSGGYSSFFNDHKERCYPQNYVEMKDKQHYNACEKGLGRLKQPRNKLSRAQTFAFGQRELEESPTASGRQCSDLVISMDVSFESPLDATKRGNARRQVSC